MADGRPALGMNIGANNDYNPEQHFIDLTMQARPWWDQGNRQISAPLTANGFPVQIPSADGSVTSAISYLVDNLSGHYPSGNYTMIIQGQGKVMIEWDAHPTASQPFSGPGTYTVPVTPTNQGIRITITQSTAGNPITAIHLIMPGFYPGYTGYNPADPSASINPNFSTPLQGMSVLRFMDNMSTNGSEVVTSTGIHSPTDYTQDFRSSPKTGTIQDDRPIQVPAPELIAAMCNKVNADCWINIPSNANDDFVTVFAQRLKAVLNPSLKVYVEYSNEIWNFSFPQGYWIGEQGISRGLLCNAGGGNSTVNDLPPRCGYQVYRSAQIWKIFEDVFGVTPGPNSRLVRVAGAFFTNSFYNNNAIMSGFHNATLNPTGQMPDALAVGAYFFEDTPSAPTSAATDLAAGLTNVQNTFTKSITGNPAGTQYQPGDAWTAQQSGIRLIAYEGGQSLYSTTVSAAANRDPGMYSLYQAMFNAWYGNGGELFVHYDYASQCGNGSCWGAQEYLGEPTSQAPKWRAILDELATMRTGVPPPPPTINACDLSKDGSLNVADVQLAVNQVVGVSACGTADLQNNGQCTVIDVQRISNAVLGQSCVVGP